MRPIHWFVAAVAAATMAAPMSATSATGAATAEGGERALPRRVELPRGWQPEGITTNGRVLFAGSLRDGAIWRANPRTGNGRVLARGREGRVAVGIDYDARRNLLWVAGGDTGRIRAHNARTGRVVARYSFGEGRFLNDLTVTRRGVFATDSFSDELAVVPLSARRLPRPGRARTLELTGAFRPVAGEFNLNGIVHSRGRLLAIQSVNGRLFRIDAGTGVTRRVRVHNARLDNGDGLELRGDVLYVVRNRNNKVVALDLTPRLRHAFRIAALRHRSLDVPTTAAAALGRLFAVNARFGTEPTDDTRYWITRLRQVRG